LENRWEQNAHNIDHKLMKYHKNYAIELRSAAVAEIADRTALISNDANLH